jgi:DNA helicase-2/ATP-dependent DNA helicase PcrA
MEGGDTQGAARIVGRDLGHLVLDDDVPTVDRLREAGIQLRDWRRASFALLREAARYPNGETWGAWLERMKEAADKAAIVLVGTTPKNLGTTFRRTKDGASKARARVARTSSATEGWEVQTIHKVKGREFDAVVHFVPKPHAKARCPSEAWWDESAQNEEREVAFVMASRARKLLILCVHAETLKALQSKRAEFLGLFEQVEVPSEAKSK